MPETPKKDDAKPLADRLVPDPKNPPDLSMLQGWLGASAEDKHRRLYLDPELSQSLEIPEDAIVHTQDIPVEVNPLGGSWVWVKADAAIKQGPGLERLYARFLRGQIQQDFFATGGAGAGGGTVGAPPTNPPYCATPTIFNCPTRLAWCRPSVFTICPSQLTLCQTRQLICQVTAPPFQSVAAPCITRVCPSAVDACPSAPGGCFELTTIIQTTTVVQPGLGQFGFEQGLGFDPGAGAGGFVGGPAWAGGQLTPAAATQIVLCQPTLIPQTCRSRLPQICITRPLPCGGMTLPWCPPQTFPPIVCPPRTLWGPGCPVSLPPGCPTGFVCFDPGGGTIVINPALQAAAGGGLGFDPNAAMDPTGGAAAGGFVGAPVTQSPGCQIGPIPISQVVICQTAAILCQTRVPQTCITRPTVCCPTIVRPWCPPTAYPPLCPPRTVWGAGCPLPTRPPGCPTGFVCFDPGGGTIVINPAVAGGGLDPAGGLGFDPNAGFDPTGGMVGAAGGYGTGYPQCYTRYPACHPTMPSYYAPLCWQ